MANSNRGVMSHELEVDDEGHRTYTVEWLLECDSPLGPGDTLLAGLVPPPGSVYDTGQDVADTWAFALPGLGLRRHDPKQGEKGYWWVAKQRYTTKAVRGDRQRCNDTTIQDPLLEPQKVSGGFKSYSEEATVDYLGNAILNSSWELLRGQTVEFDANRPTVRVEQNVADLQLALFAPMLDTLNDATLWGMDPRCIKLSSASWERKYYGSCYPYYTRTFEFDVNANTFDRVVQDEGSKVLNGDWGAAGGGWRVLPMKQATGTFSSAAGVGSITLGTTYDYSKLAAGMLVTSDAIPTGTLITSVDAALWTVYLSDNTSGVSTDAAITFTLEADPSNPNHFIRLKDKNGENMRVILDGHGRPWDPGGSTTGTGDDEPGRILVQKYGESNFLLLGIPTVF